MRREHIARMMRRRVAAENQLYTDEESAILRIDLEEIDEEWGRKRRPEAEQRKSPLLNQEEWGGI